MTGLYNPNLCRRAIYGYTCKQRDDCWNKTIWIMKKIEGGDNGTSLHYMKLMFWHETAYKFCIQIIYLTIHYIDYWRNHADFGNLKETDMSLKQLFDIPSCWTYLRFLLKQFGHCCSKSKTYYKIIIKWPTLLMYSIFHNYCPGV